MNDVAPIKPVPKTLGEMSYTAAPIKARYREGWRIRYTSPHSEEGISAVKGRITDVIRWETSAVEVRFHFMRVEIHHLAYLIQLEGEAYPRAVDERWIETEREFRERS